MHAWQSWKGDPNQTSQLYIDCEPDKPHWGWSWLERWMAARPWENRVFDTTSVSKDVFDSYSVKSDNHEYVPKRSADVPAPTEPLRLIKPQPVNQPQPPRASQPPVTPPSAYKLSAPVLIRSASPRSSIRREDIEEGGSTVSAATARSMASGPRYGNGARYSTAGSVMSRDDESLASSPSVPNYMQATQSAKAKVRSHSTPKQRPGTPEKDTSSWAATKTKRLSLPVTAENLLPVPNIGSSVAGSIILRPFRPTPYAQRSPSLRSSMPIDQGDASSDASGVRSLYR